MPVRLRIPLLLLYLSVRPVGADASDPFELVELTSPGRTVAAELIDVDGDGRRDLLQVLFVGLPPDEERRLRVYVQSRAGRLPASPTRDWALPAGAAVYDVADVSPDPGVEILLLRERGVSIHSLAGPDLTERLLAVPDPPTLAASEDERGLDRMKLVWHDLGPDPWILAPLPGRVVALSPTGAVHAVLDVGARSNYLVPPRPGPLVFESEIQLFLDVPRVAVGDVDGDGRRDVVTAARHEIRVFLRREDGGFKTDPDRVLPLALVSERDHLRGSGAVRVDVQDVDADGLVDLLLSHASGAITDARTVTAIHLNRDGSWDLEDADQVFETDGAWTTDELLDLDGDGRPELVRVTLPLSVLEMIEILVTRSLDADVRVYRSRPDGVFHPDPWARRQLGVPFSFETFRPRGFIPTVQADLNGDGHLDLLSSGGGDRLEIFLGGPEERFRRRSARQDADSRGRARMGDLDGDGLPDLVLYDPRRPGAPVVLARNRGVLPGSLPSVGSAPAD